MWIVKSSLLFTPHVPTIFLFFLALFSQELLLQPLRPIAMLVPLPPPIKMIATRLSAELVNAE